MKTKTNLDMCHIFTRNHRIKAWSLLFLFIAQLITTSVDSALFAMPPSQANAYESEGFGSSMVNEFTGDFEYNIPLLELPGTSLTYPFNLEYNSQLNMHEDASWVGFGWNLDAGQIVRELRGLPDDFKGDLVKTNRNIKAHRRLTLTLGAEILEEIFGADMQFIDVSGNFQLYYDSYTGAGTGLSATISGQNVETYSDSGKEVKTKTNELGFSYDTQGGADLKLKGKKKWMKAKLKSDSGTEFFAGKLKNAREKSTFPSTSVPMKGLGVGLFISLGPDVFGGQFAGITATGHYAERTIKSTYAESQAYGVMYESSARSLRNTETNYTMDFYLESDGPVTKFTPRLPVPIHTNDFFSVSGAGIGGVFETKRSDISILRPRNETDHFDSGELGGDVGITSPTTKIGVDGEYTNAETYHGSWTGGDGTLNGYDDFSDAADGNLFEKAYFKMIDEESTEPLSKWSGFGGDNANALNVSLNWEGVSSRPKIDDQDQSFIPTSQIRSDREKRHTHISYRTAKQVRDAWNSVPSSIKEHYVNVSQFDAPDHSVAEITITQPDGTVYVYGLPVYQNEKKDYLFSTEYDMGTDQVYGLNGIMTKYLNEEASTSNASGEYQSFDKTTTPKYASKYLLTAVYDKDYVDVLSNGPSKEDFGDYVKFIYNKVNDNFEMREPYRYAQLIQNKLYTNDDDMAQFSYTKQELYYLQRAETKTHYANFILKSDSYRTDGMGSKSNATVGSGESFSTSDSPAIHPGANNRLRALDRIELFTKGNNSSEDALLQTTYFAYSFSLCKGIPNSVGSPGSNGKLTLKEVWTNMGGNQKGTLSKYSFDYNESSPAANPNFSYLNNDRWGNYQDFTTVESNWNSLTGNSSVFKPTYSSWVSQQFEYNQAQRDEESAAWAMRAINLPTGGRIVVDYESDSYSHVQNKAATAMYGVVGFSEGDNTNYNATTWEIKKENTRIFFLLEKQWDGTPADIFMKRYTDGLKQLYFKEYVHLKNEFGDKYDYVEGYCKLKTGAGSAGIASDNDKIGWIDVEKVKVNFGAVPGYVHPFRKAAWTHIKKNCGDLLYEPLDIAPLTGNVVVQAINFFSSIAGLFTGYYGQCLAQNMSKELNEEHPSFIRLKDPDKNKFGGGSRVKSIQLIDNWQAFLNGERTQILGTEYFYVMDDGSSSGVANFEPDQGDEENALRLPEYYEESWGLNWDDIGLEMNLVTNKDYQETPFGKEMYGSTSVGYRRVVIRNLQDSRDVAQMQIDHPGVPLSELENLKVRYNNTGLLVKEFHTSKDFPVIVKKTNLDYVSFSLPSIPTPIIGIDSYNNNGYSQGFYFETNSMHGMPKSELTYMYQGQDIIPGMFEDMIPITSVTFEYQTQNPYNSTLVNKLDNTVQALIGDADVQQKNLGLDLETYIHEEEYSTKTIKGGLNANVEFTPPFVLVITAMPSVEYNEAYFRSVTFVKHAHRHAILRSVKTNHEGSSSQASYLMFDAYTGQPRLSSETNDFDNPVFNYQYAAHWYYPGMKGKFENQNAWIKLVGYNQGSGVLTTQTGASNVFTPGDVIMIYPNQNAAPVIAWVQDNITNSQINIRTREGLNPVISNVNNTGYAVVYASGNDNLAVLNSGFITALSNPVEQMAAFPMNQLEAVEDAINDALDGINDDEECSPPLQYLDACSFQECVAFNSGFVNGNFVFNILSGKDGKELFQIVIDDHSLPGNFNINDYDAVIINGPDGPYVSFVPESGVGPVINSGVIDLPVELVPCLDGVLHAGAISYSDEWLLNSPIANYPSGLGLSILPEDNPYFWHQKGEWRNKKTYSYQELRKQSEYSNLPDQFYTDISKDGTFKVFHPFDWSGQNPEWSEGQSIDAFSIFGDEIQNTDQLGNSYSRLYGHGGRRLLAECEYAKYYECANENFEDTYNSSLNGYYYTTGENYQTGHLRLENIGGGNQNIALTSAGHTGKRCLFLDSPKRHKINYVANLEPNEQHVSGFYALRNNNGENKKYLVSAWFRPSNTNSIPKIKVYTSDNTTIDVETSNVDASSFIIDGWKKVDLMFEAPPMAYTGVLSIEFSYLNGTGWIDDIRLQPYESIMSSYVYDDSNKRVTAILDDSNYATFLVYDELGAHVITNKETTQGIYTVNASRVNTKQ